MTPPLPAIPSQPSVASVTGGTWASGSGQTSASGSQAFGEYAEYRQWLNVEYSRNTNHTYPQARNPYYSLTQLSSVDVLDVRSTKLHVKVTAHTSCTIVSGVYSASSFWQPQKLSMTPFEQDKEGISYGAVDGSGVVFGPHGTITTTQPYISRRPKLPSDVAYSQTTTSTNYSLSTSSNASSITYWDGSDTTQNYDLYLDPYNDIGHAFNSKQAILATWGTDHYPITGAYNVSAESGYLNPSAGMQRLEQFIENTVTTLKNASWSYRFLVVHPQYSDNLNGAVEADRIPIMTYYNSLHHDYT